MLNHAARYDWLSSGNALRPSMLGRGRRHEFVASRDAQRDEDDTDEAIPSAATQAGMREAIDALRSGSEAAGDIINNVVESWRADNAAGGKGVFEHLPLPSKMARAIADVLGDVHVHEGERRPLFNSAVVRLDPGAKISATRQIAGMSPTSADMRLSGKGDDNGRNREGWSVDEFHEDSRGKAAQHSEARGRKQERFPEPREDYSPLNSGLDSELATSGKRTRKSDDQERVDDYNVGDVAQTVDDVIASTSWLDRVAGRAGMGVKGKGRYILTRFGWVDLQHVISAATATNDPSLNLALGVITEIGQSLWPRYWSSAWRREDLLSNWIGASALARQRLVGGSIGDAVVHVLRQLGPMSHTEARKHIAAGRGDR